MAELLECLFFLLISVIICWTQRGIFTLVLISPRWLKLAWISLNELKSQLVYSWSARRVTENRNSLLAKELRNWFTDFSLLSWMESFLILECFRKFEKSNSSEIVHPNRINSSIEIFPSN